MGCFIERLGVLYTEVGCTVGSFKNSYDLT